MTERLVIKDLTVAPGIVWHREKMVSEPNIFGTNELLHLTIKPGLHIFSNNENGFDIVLENPDIGGVAVVCYQDMTSGEDIETILIPGEIFTANAERMVLFLEYAPEPVIQTLIIEREMEKLGY